MQLAIVQDTVYRYGDTAGLIIQSLRLWPATTEGQRVAEWQVDVDGRRLQPTCLDGFGNHIATHTIESKADSMHVKIRGRVDTADTRGVHRGREGFPPMFFASCTPSTTASPQLAELAGSALDSGSSLERLQRLVNTIRDRMDCVSDRACAEQSAAAALATGSGGSGDLSQVLIAAARAADLPARYITGYLSSADAASTSSHAWSEIFVKDLGWVGFDTANRRICDDRYVRIAAGRDYRDAAAVRGVQLGGVAEAMEVTRSSPARSASQSSSGQSGQSQRQSNS
jgi:Transglutaminase-like superfamily/Bacterial transglutaminase-like N-terminal region